MNDVGLVGSIGTHRDESAVLRIDGIAALLHVTLDGVVEAPEGWAFRNFNEEMQAAMGETFARTDALMMGSRLYSEWSQHWPTSTDALAPLFNGLPKYVVSDSLDQVSWSNSILVNGDVRERIAAIKAGRLSWAYAPLVPIRHGLGLRESRYSASIAARRA